MISSKDHSGDNTTEQNGNGGDICEAINGVLGFLLPGMPVDTGFPESRQSLYQAWEDHALIRASFCSRLSDIFRLAMLPDMDKHPEAARLALFCIAAWQMEHMVPDLLDILKENQSRQSSTMQGSPLEKRVFIPLDTLFAELEVPAEAFDLSQWIGRLGFATARYPTSTSEPSFG
jgi:hypothetical protein